MKNSHIFFYRCNNTVCHGFMPYSISSRPFQPPFPIALCHQEQCSAGCGAVLPTLVSSAP